MSCTGVGHLAQFKTFLIFTEVHDAQIYSKISQILHKISTNIHVKFGEVLYCILPKLTVTKYCQSSDVQNSLKLCKFLNFDLFLPLNPFSVQKIQF